MASTVHLNYYLNFSSYNCRKLYTYKKYGTILWILWCDQIGRRHHRTSMKRFGKMSKPWLVKMGGEGGYQIYHRIFRALLDLSTPTVFDHLIKQKGRFLIPEIQTRCNVFGRLKKTKPTIFANFQNSIRKGEGGTVSVLDNNCA